MSLSLINKTQLAPNVSDLVSGYGVNFFYPLKSNPSGFLTGVGFNTGIFLTTGQSLGYYSTSNPSGFITGNLSNYTPLNIFTGLSGSFKTFTGNFAAANYVTNGYLNTALSQYIQTSSVNFNNYYLASNPNGYVQSTYLSTYYASKLFLNATGNTLNLKIAALSGTMTGNYATISNLNLTGSGLGVRIDNVSNSLTTNYATTGSLNTTGTILSNNIRTTGANLVNIISQTGFFVNNNLRLTGQFLSQSISSIVANNYATSLQLTGAIASLYPSLLTSGKQIITGFKTFNTGVAVSGSLTLNNKAVNFDGDSKKVFTITLHSPVQTGAPLVNAGNYIGGGFAPYSTISTANFAMVPFTCTIKSYAWHLYLPTFTNAVAKNWSFYIQDAIATPQYQNSLGNIFSTITQSGFYVVTGALSTPIVMIGPDDIRYGSANTTNAVTANWGIAAGGNTPTGSSNVITLYCYY